MCELGSALAGLDFDPMAEFRVGRWKFDGGSEPLRLLVEYDGSFWHNGDSARGHRKVTAARKDGWTPIRLRCFSKKFVAPVEYSSDIQIDETQSAYDTALRVLEKLVEISAPSFRLKEGGAIKSHREQLVQALASYREAGGPVATELADRLIAERSRRKVVT
jgi:hypothetical protein